MEAKIYGAITRPAVLVVGTWDPFVPDYLQLLDHINNYCADAGYNFLPVLLEPSPHHLLIKKVAPIYDCCEARMKYLKSRCSVVSEFSMKESELGDGVEDFLAVYFKQNVKIAELWLYEGQTMGRGGKSNVAVLTQACLKIGILVKTIPRYLNFKASGSDVKKLLEAGLLEEATSIVMRPPLWIKQDNRLADIPIGWKVGSYEYVPAGISLDLEVLLLDAPGILQVYLNEKGDAVFDWPDPRLDTIAIVKSLKE